MEMMQTVKKNNKNSHGDFNRKNNM